MTIDLAFLLFGWFTTLVVAVGKGAFGGGLAILSVPLLSFVVDPVDAAVITAPLVAFMDVFALRAFGGATRSWPDLVWLLPGAVAGIGVGALVFAALDPRWIGLLIGTITLAFAAHYFLRGRLAPAVERPVSPPLALVAGTASGFTTFVAHAGGPPVTLYLIGRGLSKTVFAGTTVAFFLLGNLLKLPPYLMLGWERPGALMGALALAPAVPVGMWIGRRLHDQLPRESLYFWCYVLLTLGALKLFADAVRALLA